MAFNVGVSFSDDTSLQATATDVSLTNLLASATASGVTMGEFAETAHVLLRSATNPSEDQGNKTIWFDETDGKYKVRADAANKSYHDWLETYQATNKDDDTHIPLGALVVSNGRYQVTRNSVDENPNICGVALTTLPTTGDRGNVRKFGVCEVQCEGAITPGDLLVASNVTGYAKSGTQVNSNHNFTAGLAFGQALFGQASGQNLVTCLVFS